MCQVCDGASDGESDSHAKSTSCFRCSNAHLAVKARWHHPARKAHQRNFTNDARCGYLGPEEDWMVDGDSYRSILTLADITP